MASEEKPDEADDGMADWAEALLEQKSTDPASADPQSGGVLSGGAPKSFSSMTGDGSSLLKYDSEAAMLCKVCVRCSR